MSSFASAPAPAPDDAFTAARTRDISRGDAADAGATSDAFKTVGGPLKFIDGLIKTFDKPAKGAPAAVTGPDKLMREAGASAGLLGNALGMGAGLFKVMKGVAERDDAETRDKGTYDILGGLGNIGSGLLGALDLSGYDKAIELASAEAAPALRIAQNSRDLLKRGLGSAFSFVSGGAQVASGVDSLSKNGLSVDGVIDTASGVMGLGSGVASAMTAAEATAAAGSMGAAGAGTAATASAATLASGALAGAPLALALGAGAGKMMNSATEASSRGNFGRDEHGRLRTASDEATDTGLAFEGWLGAHGAPELVANAGGAMSSMGKGVANVPINAIMNLYGWLTE